MKSQKSIVFWIKKRYNKTMDLQTKIRELPTNSGVYIMKNAQGEVIYVGKAKNLKNRVSQYFQNSKSHTIKVRNMVSHIADFYYIITPNEVEAFALENNLIKRFMPYYNILLKDGKSYPYIRIDVREDYPRLEITRKLKRDGARYFGPYFAGIRAGELLQMLHHAFPLRMCGGKLASRQRPCINHDMGLCVAPCMGGVTREDYHQILDRAIEFLNGKYEGVQEVLREKMLRLAENEQFEAAIAIRDDLNMLDRLKQRTLTFLPNLDDIDAFAWASNGAVASVAVLVVRGGRSVGVDCYHLLDPDLGQEESLRQFLTQYYSTQALPPSMVLLPFEPEQAFKDWLTEQRKTNAGGRIGSVDVQNPKKGAKRQLLDIAQQNATLYLDKAVESERRNFDLTTGAVEKLGEILHLPRPPRRMECYDISNIGGVLSVASMIVFLDGVAQPSLYRKFKIKTVQGADDFASMREVITRRLNELSKPEQNDPSFGNKPDLIVVDGGKGQLSNAAAAIAECGYTDIALVGLAKQQEEIFVPDKSQPILLPRSHNALKLLQRIRDESHRFAITFHRSLRNKVSSILEEIDGIGPTKRRNLIRHFKSLDKIKAASIEELIAVPGITQKDAQKISEYFG